MTETDTGGCQASEGLCVEIMGWAPTDSMTISNYRQEPSQFLFKPQAGFPFTHFQFLIKNNYHLNICTLPRVADVTGAFFLFNKVNVSCFLEKMVSVRRGSL